MHKTNLKGPDYRATCQETRMNTKLPNQPLINSPFGNFGSRRAALPCAAPSRPGLCLSWFVGFDKCAIEGKLMRKLGVELCTDMAS